MAFGFRIFIFALLYRRFDSQNTTDALQETNFEEAFTLQVNDDNVTHSTVVTHTDNFEGLSVTEQYSSSITDATNLWENSNTSREWTSLEKETSDTLPDTASSLEVVTSGTSTFKSSEVDIISFGEDPRDNSDQSNEVNKSTSTPQSGSESNEGTEHLSPDTSNVTVSSDEWISTYSSCESRDYKSNSSSKVQEDILILLRSNCSIVNTENIPLNDVFAEVGCTIYLRINVSLENGTRDKLLSSLEKLTLKPSSFQVVQVYDQAEDASRQKQQKHRSLFEPETFAYLAVAFCFAFLLLLAIIVFGFRCFKKRKPSSDVSAFDVKLSSYTLTKIPRASLTSMDCSPASDSLDDKTESPLTRSRNCGSCESGLDIIPCDTFLSNREMKTFGVSRSRGNTNIDSPSDVYPQHSAIAYENHTFQRYF